MTDPWDTEPIGDFMERAMQNPLPKGYRAKQTPHGRLKKACRIALRKISGGNAVLIPVHNLKVSTPDGRSYQTGRPGASDDIWLYRAPHLTHGLAVAVEYKYGADRQSERQKLFQQAWERAGGVYIVARSPDQLVTDVTAALARGRA